MYKETKLFKKYDYPSWSLAPKVGENGQIIKFKDNQVTNWTKYIEACNKCSLEVTGYTLNLFKRDKGIKGIKKLSFSNILKYNGKITAKKFLNARLKAEQSGFYYIDKIAQDKKVNQVDVVKDFKAGFIQYGRDKGYIK